MAQYTCLVASLLESAPSRGKGRCSTAKGWNTICNRTMDLQMECSHAAWLLLSWHHTKLLNGWPDWQKGLS